MDLNNIESVEFVLENCESMIVPKKYIKRLELRHCGNEEYELECEIEGMDDIEYLATGDKRMTPLERLHLGNDITYVKVKFGKEIKNYTMVWKNNYSSTNDKFQSSELKSYKELNLSVKINNNDKLKLNKCKHMIKELLKEIEGESEHVDCNKCCFFYGCSFLRKTRENTLCGTLKFIL